LKKLLFISHDAQLAGAPLLLLRFLRLLAQSKKYEIEILVKADGPLYAEFCQIGKTYVWQKNHLPLGSHTVQLICHRLGILAAYQNWQQKLHLKKLIRQIHVANYHLIVANTIASGEILQQLGPQYCPIISYIHELALGFDLFSTKENIAYQLQHSQGFWVPSSPVKDFLQEKHQIPAHQITVLQTVTQINQHATIAADKLLKSYNLTTKDFIVGAMASLDHRKGYDIFLEIALLLKNHINIKFMWVGANKTSQAYAKTMEYIAENSLNNIIIVETQPNAQDYFQIFKLFLLPSREDPYPLVTLEAAQNALPTVTFDSQAGGACDFVANNAGQVVPYMNIGKMAEAIMYFYQNPTILSQMGAAALAKVTKNHSPEAGFKQLTQLIETSIENKNVIS
jgi:glycosyltransferase involved in cell wall biosynthesis